MTLSVPFFRVEVSDDEINAVAAALRSGWLTTGPRVREFEAAFADSVGAQHAVALNSCTAALHLAIEACGIQPGDVVVVPTQTFAATAEVVRYFGALPLLVDCDPETGHLLPVDVHAKLTALRQGTLGVRIPNDARVAGVIAMHYGGLMQDPRALRELSTELGGWLIEDAAHAFPAAIGTGTDWVRCGENTADVTCFSFYANKTITTGEGGMAVTNESALADRIRLMSLHGLSRDAWSRFETGSRSWDYRIIAPGYKYNMTDSAAALGLGQLARAEAMREARERRALQYRDALGSVEALDLPPAPADRRHSWHLFPIRLVLDRLQIDRNAFIDHLREAGVACSVHYRPLHLHPYYSETFGWRPEHAPCATETFARNLSLPLFSSMRDDEFDHVVSSVRTLCERHAA